MNKLLRRFIKNNRGNTAVEFALIMPLLILLISGIFEICMFSLVNNKLVRIAGTLSNVISMQNVTATKLLAIMNTADEMAKPFTFATKGSVVVSQIYNLGKTTNPANMRISWQQKTGASVSRFGLPGTRPAALPSGLSILNDESVIITEVFYTYKPFVFKAFIPNQVIYKLAIYVPRLGDMTTLLTN